MHWMTTAAKPILRSARRAVRRLSNGATGRSIAARWNVRACGTNSNPKSITTGRRQRVKRNKCCCVLPQGGFESLRPFTGRPAQGFARIFAELVRGDTPKRKTPDGTSKLSAWIRQKIAKSCLDMHMIDTEWKGEIQQSPEFTASMSSTISRYIRTILRQYLEKSDTI